MAAIRLTVVMLERGVGPSSQPPAFEGGLFGLTEGRTGNSKFGVCGRLPQGAVEHGCTPPFARAGPSEAQPIFACFALFSDEKQGRSAQPTLSLLPGNDQFSQSIVAQLAPENRDHAEK